MKRRSEASPSLVHPCRINRNAENYFPGYATRGGESRTYAEALEFDASGRPINPVGRTGLAGRGLLLGGQASRHPLTQRRRQGLAILVIGWGLALLALWHSRLWLWELNESWDPRPVATQVRALPADAPVWLKGPTRPSLGWYAGRILLQYRKSDPPKEPHWLVSNKPIPGCLPSQDPAAGEWKLWRGE